MEIAKVMTFNKKNIITLIGSFLTIPIWGWSFLDSQYANIVTVFYGMIFTVFLFQWLKSTYYVEQKKDFYFFAMIGPTFYLIAMILLQGNALNIFFNPILFAFILMLFCLYTQIEKKVFLSFLIVGIFGYVSIIFPMYQRRLIISDIKFESLIEKKHFINETSIHQFPEMHEEIKKKFNLDNYDYVLIETWNEKCSPCLSSIKDLEDFFQNQSNILHILLYQKMREKNLSEDQIYEFDLIKNKDKILIDYDNIFFEKLNLQSYPYFILYDRNGSSVDYFSGYISHFQAEYRLHLMKMIK